MFFRWWFAIFVVRQRLTTEVKTFFKELVGYGVAGCLSAMLKWSARRHVLEFQRVCEIIAAKSGPVLILKFLTQVRHAR